MTRADIRKTQVIAPNFKSACQVLQPLLCALSLYKRARSILRQLVL